MYQPFNLLFYKGNSFIGLIIKKLTNGQYSHVTLLLDSFHCLETTWNNPSVIRHFDYKAKSYDIYRIKFQLTKHEKQIVLQYIIDHIETGYDFIYLLTRCLNLLFNTKIINSKKYLTCDELIVEAFNQIGINLIDDEILTPSSLAKSKYLEKAIL